MEKLISYSINHCFMCHDALDAKYELSVVTSFSEKPIYELIENFIDLVITDEILEEAGICQACYCKFDEYDEHHTKADLVQNELVALFNNLEEATVIKEDVTEEYYETIGDTPNEGFVINEIFDEGTEDADDTKVDYYDATKDFQWEHEQSIAENVQILTDNTQRKGHDSFEEVDKSLVKKFKPKNDNLEDRKYRCDICNGAFKEKSKLKAHRDIHKTERNVICPICGKAFKTQACLRSHRRVHNPSHVFCDTCGKSYTQKHELAKHIRIVHLNIRDFRCEVCGSKFGSKAHLTAHTFLHQDNQVKPFTCLDCAQSFVSRAKLTRHSLSHTKERNFSCGQCGKRFLYSYNVTAHIKHVHMREKRKREEERVCVLCNKSFRKLWALRQHMSEAHDSADVMICEEVDEIEELVES